MSPLKTKKYRINECLDKLPVKQNKKAIAVLPGQLNVSVATFNNYRAIGVDDPQDIPHSVVVKLEQFFGLKPGELQNYDVKIKPISTYTDADLNSLAGSLGLNK